MNKKQYYEMMGNFDSIIDLKELEEKWLSCFSYVLKSFRIGYTDKIIKDLFYDFDMDNWEVFHRENTKYKNSTAKQIFSDFCSEASYISDRVSYDRLFRTHWLFRQYFELRTDKGLSWAYLDRAK